MKQQLFWLFVVSVTLASCTINTSSRKAWGKPSAEQKELIIKYKQSLKDLYVAIQTDTNVRDATEIFWKALEQVPLPWRVYYAEQTSSLFQRWKTQEFQSEHNGIDVDDPYMN